VTSTLTQHLLAQAYQGWLKAQAAQARALGPPKKGPKFFFCTNIPQKNYCKIIFENKF